MNFLSDNAFNISVVTYNLNLILVLDSKFEIALIWFMS